MGLKRLTGSKQLVNLKADVRLNVAPPSLAVYYPAQANIRALALGLLGITAVHGEEARAALHEAAAALDDAEDAEWSQEEARHLLKAVGTVPAPSHVKVERLEGQATLLFRSVKPDDAGAEPLNYREGSAQPTISLLAALRPDGISVPKGMCMEVPVKLVEDDDGLALAAFFSRGKLRDATAEPGDQEPSN